MSKGPHLPSSQPTESFWPLIEAVQSTLIGLIVFVAAIAPLALPPLVVALFIITIAQDHLSGPGLAGTWRRLSASPATLIGLAFMALAVASSLWAVRPAYTLQSVAQCALTGFGAWYVAVSLSTRTGSIDSRRRTRFTRAVPIGAIFVGIYFTLDALTGDQATLFFARNFPSMFDGLENTIQFRDGIAEKLSDVYFNRTAAALSMIVVGLAAALQFWPMPALGRTLGLLAAVGAVLISLKSNSATALLALAAAFAGFALALWSSRQTMRLLQVVFAIAVMGAIPLSMLPKALHIEQNERLPLSFRERVLIWDHIGRDALQAPWIGVGVQSVKFTPKLRATLVPSGNAENKTIAYAHPHNGYLQVWVELGLVGALLFMLSGLSLIRRIASLSPAMQPFALALTAATLAMIGPGWGLWQPWMIAAIGFGWICLVPLQAEFASADR